VRFEDCFTPVQVIASERNEIWPYEMVERNFKRLGGGKEMVTLRNAPQWDTTREFHEAYCEHVLRWFRANQGMPEARRTRVEMPVLARNAASGTLTLTGEKPQEFELTAGVVSRIGRDVRNEVHLLGPAVSHFHAEIVPVDSGFRVRDLNSTNGVRLNGERILPIPEERQLVAGDRLQIGEFELVVDIHPAAPEEMPTVADMGALAATVAELPTEPGVAKTQVFTALPPRTPARVRSAGQDNLPSEPFVLPGPSLTIGRGAANGLVLPHPTISGVHARIDWIGTHYAISDLGSMNGTFVGDTPVPRAPETLPLTNGDTVRLGAVSMIFELARQG
jgi:pSer/pThr/pTyr-binding forkhead associated (FHA) protein